MQLAGTQASPKVSFTEAQMATHTAAKTLGQLYDPAVAHEKHDMVYLTALLYLMHARDKLGLDDPPKPTL